MKIVVAFVVVFSIAAASAAEKSCNKRVCENLVINSTTQAPVKLPPKKR